MKEKLNKIVFHIRKQPVRVKDILILMLILLLLLLLCKCTPKKSEDKKVEEAVREVCKFPKQNIKDLNDILSRGDLCSEPWFEDVEIFIKRLEDQNKVLKGQKGKQAKALYKKQVELMKRLKAFRKDQNDTTIDALEKALKAYQKQSKKGC